MVCELNHFPKIYASRQTNVYDYIVWTERKGLHALAWAKSFSLSLCNKVFFWLDYVIKFQKINVDSFIL